MKKLFLAIAFVFAASFATAQTDQIDFSRVQIVNAPDVRSWPVTTAITQISFSGGKTRVEFTKKNGANRWPDVTPAGWTGPLEFTLWLCVKTPDWACSGFIQFWNGRDGSGDGPSNPDVPSLYNANWYYAARWAPIYGHGAIQPGETIAFLVTSGNQRDSVGPNSVQERSNVVMLAATDNGTFDFSNVPTPTPTPTPTPPVPSDLDARVTALQVQMLDVLNRLAAVNDYAQSVANRMEAVNTALDSRVKVLEARTIPTSCAVRAIGVTFSCRLN